MRFAKWTFLIAGIYGLLVLIPQYFLEERTSQDYPPAITHPEFYYGFIGLAIAWQVAFLIISRDPTRYRLLMIPSILEKASFGVAVLWLYSSGRVYGPILGGAFIDLVLGILFVIAYLRTPRAQ
jgi:hypothetical protein